MTHTNNTYIHIENLSYSESSHRALENINLSLKKGSITYLYSSSYSERKSFINIITGKVLNFNGALNISKGTTIGFTSNESYIKELNIEENIFLGQNIKIFTKKNNLLYFKKASELLRKFGLKNIDIKTSNLEKQYRDIVCITKLLLAENDVSIFYDVSSNLSTEQKIIFLGECEKLTRKNKSIIISNHQFIRPLTSNPNTNHDHILIYNSQLTHHLAPCDIEKSAIEIILTNQHQSLQAIHLLLQQERLKSKNIDAFINFSMNLIGHLYNIECSICVFKKNYTDPASRLFYFTTKNIEEFREIIHTIEIEKDTHPLNFYHQNYYLHNLDLKKISTFSYIHSSCKRNLFQPIESVLDIFSEQLFTYINELNIQNKVIYTQRLDSLAQIAGGISHDLNNTLFVISSAILLIQESNIITDIKQYTTTIEKACKDASDLSSKLLSISRKKNSSHSTIDLKLAATDVIQIFSKSISQNIQITHAFTQKTANTKGDLQEIKSSLLNLLLNASQALSEDGHINIKIKNEIFNKEDRLYDVEQTLIDGNFIEVSIQDNGRGIDIDKIKYVIEPFYTTRADDGGSGLGLSIVHSMIKEHQGHLRIDSKPDHGTLISLFFQKSEESTEQPHIKIPIKNTCSGSLLICDDNTKIRNLLSTILTNHGYKCTPVESAEECLSLYTKDMNAYDLIILDDIMPSMTGSECFKKLKTINKDVKVFMLSGYRKEPNIEALYAQGLLNFFIKPVDISQFVAAIESAL